MGPGVVWIPIIVPFLYQIRTNGLAVPLARSRPVRARHILSPAIHVYLCIDIFLMYIKSSAHHNGRLTKDVQEVRSIERFLTGAQLHGCGRASVTLPKELGDSFSGFLIWKFPSGCIHIVQKMVGLSCSRYDTGNCRMRKNKL